VGIRKTIAVEVSKLIQTASKPGYVFDLGMSLTDTRLLVRWCPAWRWREPDLLLPRGTWEGVPWNCRPVRAV